MGKLYDKIKKAGALIIPVGQELDKECTGGGGKETAEAIDQRVRALALFLAARSHNSRACLLVALPNPARAAILVLQCEAMLQYACKMDNMQVGGVGWTSQDTNILLVNKFGVGNAPKVRVLVGKFAALGPAGLGQIVPGLAGLSSNGECKWISLLLTMLGVPPRLFQCTDLITAVWPVGVWALVRTRNA